MAAKHDPTNHPFEVGMEVLIDDVNRRGRPLTEAVVSKVGRKLVYATMYGRDVGFRLETRAANDNYGHQSIWTPEEVAERERRAYLDRRLATYGLRSEFGGTKFRELPTEVVEELLEVLDRHAERDSD
ncbi:hypothetical protein SEA_REDWATTLEHOG_160 [Gordonia phage RedWattleHog]|uniref:Uncharacterized protein n=1 Tax=Gordonia phage Stormageddon TaxID=2656541 RepID=A0A649VRZ5_9CAUD|nr:hypothetical protein KHQ86_gp139 [Gordonia phage Stormageddon]QGJ95021.1 hypothetical protein SEA_STORMAGEDDON_161 [Gordonia phage Stormageddon]QLF83663.1 hypothetical protein SEA_REDWATTLEHOG_160 [Gordonia phage RedWattleHog]